MTLKGEALHSGASNAQGIYILQPNIVNGKTFWLNKNGQRAIWYLSKGLSMRRSRWGIGHPEDFGKAYGWVASPDDVAEPQETTTWEYYNGTIWKTSNPGDVIVDDIQNSKNLISINMKSIVIPWPCMCHLNSLVFVLFLPSKFHGFYGTCAIFMFDTYLNE